MKNVKVFSLLLSVIGTATFAQDLEQAKKAVDAEQYEKAKKILKSLVASDPNNGRNFFYLGDLYLNEQATDSAKIFFEKGIAAKDKGAINYIGLGEINLDNGDGFGAEANFAKATKDIKKKDTEEFLLIGRAYTKSERPDYKKAIENLKKVLVVDPKSAQAYLSLGDAYYGERNTNEAYSAYRNAYDYDNSLLMAKIKLAVITKNAKAFPEAVKSFNEIVATNPNYGPVYRELAETYYHWGASETSNYNAYVKKALEYYEKYMSLTDYSLESRMRHADFLILAKDYKALEAEAKKMQQLDKVNPRILRYLGYSAHENGNHQESVKALNEYISKVEAKKIIARDYLYLGLAKIALSKGADGKYEKGMYDQGIEELNKAVEKDPIIATELNEIGLKLFKEKFYREAGKIFEVAVKNQKSKNYLYDNFYLGYALYFDYDEKTSPKDELVKADAAFTNVIAASPTTQDAHLYKAKVNRVMDTPESKKVMVSSYEQYVKIVKEKGETEKAKNNLIEAYTYVGAYYANNGEKAKAIENLKELLVLEPGNKYATDTLKKL
ncbi:tetratricopeptide repeat protein [Flavobacterium supellecticarium]|uniref:Tetratricopeptide repeat protein n=1 Tax=Flavobacterium supellecticarium TaxID=2565924 RepID=A0A4V3W7X7_9FLAO|nr:tetratricopeptide repeat protein [Flavobacterium supellecticarium]THF49088.1 tetratricopeptide repeat protein [Flavobacterium supellecticarium]